MAEVFNNITTNYPGLKVTVRALKSVDDEPSIVAIDFDGQDGGFEVTLNQAEMESLFDQLGAIIIRQAIQEHTHGS